MYVCTPTSRNRGIVMLRRTTLTISLEIKSLSLFLESPLPLLLALNLNKTPAQLLFRAFSLSSSSSSSLPCQTDRSVVMRSPCAGAALDPPLRIIKLALSLSLRGPPGTTGSSR
jgi:hypothetical protein